MKKPDYDTWENAKLIEINDEILKHARLFDTWLQEYEWRCIGEVGSAAATLDPEQFRKFVETCNQHEPWIWKDPRLWLTIGHWIKFLPKENVSFLIISREPLQAWISAIIRRKIQTFGYLERYYSTVHDNIVNFLDQEKLDYVDIVYEDLILRPEQVLDRINKATGNELSLADFKSVFKGKLYGRQHGVFNFLKAAAIYLKNYGERRR